MVRVLLVQPNDDIRKRYKTEGGFHAPASLIYLATAIERKHDVKVFDRNTDPEDKDFFELIEKFNPEIIGFNSMTSPMLLDIIYLGPKIKKILPKTKIIIGGVHATVEPDSVINENYVDYILRGEGEEAFLEFCDNLRKGKNKLSKIKNINKNPTRPLIADMNTIKFPNYNFINLKKYNNVWISTSRGCPGNCSFCYNARMWGKNGYPCVRMYNTKNTIKLFQEAIEKWGIMEFTIADDNFTTFKKRCIDVCNFLEKRYNRKISFYISARADSVDREILRKIRKAGCNTIQYGSESGSQRVLNYLNKNETVEQQGKAIELARKEGLFNCSSFMVGIPTETIQEMNETKRFIKKYKPDIADAKFFQLLPGNKIFDELVEKNKLTKPQTLKEWADWTEGLKGMKHNYSNIPDELLSRTVKELWKYRYFRTQLKKAFWWLKKGKVRYVFGKIKRFLKRKI